MLFKDYSQANCKFECQLKAAYEKCHCVPWDYPHLNDSMAICDGYVREIFKEIMVNPETKEACQFCENDCTTTSYSYSVYATKIDANFLCKPKPDDDPQESISNFAEEQADRPGRQQYDRRAVKLSRHRDQNRIFH